jgi:hypothetical protein
MAAMAWEPLGGYREILEGGFPPYHYYAVLLCTNETGLDAQIQQHVVDNWDSLDHMTGEVCLVFSVADQAPGSGRPDRTFPATAVYDIAREFGVRMTDLPAVVVFLTPTAPDVEMLIVPMVSYLPSDGIASEDITRAFRGLATAMFDCSTKSYAERLDCLRGAIEADIDGLFAVVTFGRKQ